jgi:hypothetical protein
MEIRDLVRHKCGRLRDHAYAAGDVGVEDQIKAIDIVENLILRLSAEEMVKLAHDPTEMRKIYNPPSDILSIIISYFAYRVAIYVVSRIYK